MISDEIKASMRSTPFQPFTVHLADGRAVLIHHHEHAWLLPSGLEFYVVDRAGQHHLIATSQVTKLTRGKPAPPRPKRKLPVVKATGKPIVQADIDDALDD